LWLILSLIFSVILSNLASTVEIPQIFIPWQYKYCIPNELGGFLCQSASEASIKFSIILNAGIGILVGLAVYAFRVVFAKKSE
jgi:hypothetical protein